MLDRHAVFGECLLRAGQVLAKMQQDELAQLTRSAPVSWQNWLEALRSELEKQGDEPIQQTLPVAFEASWSQGLQELVLNALHTLP